MWPPDEWVDESGNPVVVFGRKTFDNGTTTNLFINVTGINDNGQICGHISFTRQNGSTGELKSFLAAFRTVATLEAPTLLGPGDVEVAVAPDGYRSPYAHSINYSGDVAGDIARVADSMREAFVWPAGPNEIAPLPIQQQSGAPAVDCSARAINDNGVVAGWMHVSGPGYIHAFVYDPAIKEGNATLDLTLRGGASKDGVLYGCAWDVNDYDDVVGFTTNPASWCQQAFRYTDAGELVNLGFLTGKQLYAGGVASAINNQGQAVGMSYYVKTSTTTVFKQFLYTQECGMMDLWGLITNPQVEEADFNYSQQYDGSSLHISNCADGYTFGRICGRTYTSHRPYVLTPIPPSN